ncbi:MAG TPA: M67 family metallopeptidase [Candidatus Limnocylindrales bacterium]|nr:M67 family metallopeptidase [Candidatus Limnocylindrales bacterium]
MHLPAALFEGLVDWARRGYPNEACGIIAGDALAHDGGRALRFHATANAAASPYRYRIDPQEQLRIVLALDDADEVVWGIFHSHVRSPAEPSPTDVGLALWPGSLYLICSLADPERPVIRAWSIEDGSIEEVALEIG